MRFSCYHASKSLLFCPAEGPLETVYLSHKERTVKQIEDAFKEFTTREDIAIVFISQYVANVIRFLVDSYNKPIPAILKIPSKDHPYDPAHDSGLDFSMDEVLAVTKDGTIKIGLDIGGGVATFALRMRERNITIVTTTINLNKGLYLSTFASH